MPQILRIASAQSRTLSTTPETLHALESTTKDAAKRGIDILLFPEAYLGGYPRTCTFGSAVGGRTASGREQFLHYFHDAVDLGDTPAGAGDAWINRTLPLPRDKKHRGDGTREELERIAKETGVFIITGLVERCAGTLYCGAVYVCPRYGVIGKRRKVMPTGSERMVWGQGSASSLRAVTTEIKGVRVCMAAAICWENYMPLLRQALYSQNVNLWLAPTADARDTWASLMRTIGVEGRCFVVSANQCVRRRNLPDWITGEGKKEVNGTAEKTEKHQDQGHWRRKSTIIVTEDQNEICIPCEEGGKPHKTEHKAEHADKQPDQNRGRRKSTIIVTEDHNEICIPVCEANALRDNSSANHHGESHSPSQIMTPTPSSLDDNDFACRGGSCIISPMGEVLEGPLWDVEDGGLLIRDIDFEDCERGRLDLDVAGSYSRMDSFHLTVDGLDLNPPP